MKLGTRAVVPPALMIFFFCAGHNNPPAIAKDEITVAVTDSGLGGLSIMADAAARLQSAGLYKKANLVFFNALFSNDSGYNSLPNREAKIRVFDGALRSLDSNFHPDVILVGCNTLSVLLPDTPFARTAKTPIRGIVEPGAALLAEAWRKTPAATVILFGTETTIAEGAHRARLIELGVPGEKIIVQACPELASYIENDWKSDETGLLISSYVDEALARLPSPAPLILAGLVCTHYGYAREAWSKAFAEKGIALTDIINPNNRLADTLFPAEMKKRFPRTEIAARVVSMVEITENKRRSLGEWLERVSPEVAAALRFYALQPDLFEWAPAPRK
jgi:glutamate racemase